MKNIFDAYCFVDWSANNAPKLGADSIWMAIGGNAPNDLEATLVNKATRQEATAWIREQLLQRVFQKQRILVCFDFALGYPLSIGSPGLGDSFRKIARLLAEKISDDEKNRNNRFEVADELNRMLQSHPADRESLSISGPFWGRPRSKQNDKLESLQPTKPGYQLSDDQTASGYPEFRVIERRMRLQGLRPFSPWQLYGNGAVGGQTLVGIPRIWQLLNEPDLQKVSVVWPFETGWSSSPSKDVQVVYSEFWPGIIPMLPRVHAVKDARQVISSLRWARALDECGELASFFAPTHSQILTDSIAKDSNEKDAIAKESVQSEGWILGFR